MSENMKKSAFSLAEMMVVMLIMSIVLAAMAPIVTTRMRSKSPMTASSGSSDGPWYWVDPSSKSGDAFTTASKLMVGQNEAGADDAMLILNKGDDEKDNILFKNSSGTLGRLDISNSNALALGTATLTAGSPGIAVGFDNIIEGHNEVAIGFNNEASGFGTIAIGNGNEVLDYSAIAIGYNNTASYQAIAIGKGNDATEDYSLAIGGSAYATAKSSIAIGNGVYKTTASGRCSIAIGSMDTYNQGTTEVSGDSSIALGTNSKATGAHSVAIGGRTEATGANSVAIGYGVKAPNQYDFVLGQSYHNVQIPGTLAVAKTLTVSGTNVPSDKRLKYLQGENKSGLDVIRQMKVYNFIYKKDPKKERHTGVIAQELQKILPYAVKKGSDGFLTIRIDDIIYALVNAVKQLDKSVQELTKEVKAHNQKLEEISKRLDKLEGK